MCESHSAVWCLSSNFDKKLFYFLKCSSSQSKGLIMCQFHKNVVSAGVSDRSSSVTKSIYFLKPKNTTYSVVYPCLLQMLKYFPILVFYLLLMA